jgi:hypothetical protein
MVVIEPVFTQLAFPCWLLVKIAYVEIRESLCLWYNTRDRDRDRRTDGHCLFLMPFLFFRFLKTVEVFRQCRLSLLKQMCSEILAGSLANLRRKQVKNIGNRAENCSQMVFWLWFSNAYLYLFIYLLILGHIYCWTLCKLNYLFEL